MITKYLTGLCLIIAFMAGYAWYWDDAGKQSRQSEIDSLNAKIEAMDIIANKLKQEGEQNAKKISSDYMANINGINDYYNRMLQEARNKISTNSAISSSKRVDVSTCESTITGCPVDIEQNCAQDALTVKAFQEYVIKNNIPIQ